MEVSQTERNHSVARVSEIDLLRFVAALSVVIFHYSFRGAAAGGRSDISYPMLVPIFKYGYLGVELFFMISGFVILMSARNSDPRGFIVSRVVRLYPAFWAACTLTAGAIFLFADQRYSVTLRQYLVNMTMLAGFVGVSSIDGVYWSLYIEIHFYLLVLLVLSIGWIDRMDSLIDGWLVVLVLERLFPSYTVHSVLMLEYAPYFICGALYYRIYKHGFSMATGGMFLISWSMCIVQSLLEAAEFSNYYHSPLDRAVVVALVTSFQLAMLAISLRVTGWLRRCNWSALGALTYPLYLLHQNIGFIGFNRWANSVQTDLIFWGTLIAMLLLAWVVHQFFEKPVGSLLLRGMKRHKPIR